MMQIETIITFDQYTNLTFYVRYVQPPLHDAITGVLHHDSEEKNSIYLFNRSYSQQIFL